MQRDGTSHRKPGAHLSPPELAERRPHQRHTPLEEDEERQTEADRPARRVQLLLDLRDRGYVPRHVNREWYTTPGGPYSRV